MKKITRIFAVILTAALAAMMCVMCVSAASLLSTAKEILPGRVYSDELTENSGWFCYKINVSSSGTLSAKFTSEVERFGITIYNDDGEEMKTEYKITCGGYSNDGYYYFDSNNRTFKGTVYCKVTPGTYYILVSHKNVWAWDNFFGKYSFSVSVPDGNVSNNKSSGSSSGKNVTIKLNMEVGDKIDLSAMSGNKEVNAKWTSSNSKVAKVSSKGKITALKEGTCTITWTSGSSTFTIYVEVE